MSFDRYMEASLLDLIFHIASVSLSQVTQHLAEYPFQGVVPYLSPVLSRSLYGLVPIVADIYGSSV